MLEINEQNFESISGMELILFLERVHTGDSWGRFLKIVSILETSTKRAIGIKLGLDPANKYLGKQEFMNTVHLCAELNIISNEARQFVIKLIEIRNKLVHTTGQLILDIQELQGEKFYKNYIKQTDNYVRVSNAKIDNGDSDHFIILITGCTHFINQISESLYPSN